jgi:8-oxo-dGTP pyrophosphatase MutT (NUDIX family)
MMDTPPVTPRPSATVVVVREGEDAPEILLVRRRAGDAFGNSYTFPGGVIDPDESDSRPVCSGLTADDADTILGVTDGLDYYSAAIRELFEETGILLAKDDQGNWPRDTAVYAEKRVSVDRGDLPWPEFLRDEGLCMAADALKYFAWWITPEVSPKRWTTRFFAAALPAGQLAEHDGTELTDSRWLTAKDALALQRAGNLKLPQPTRRNLNLLEDLDSVAALLEWAGAKHRSGITHICPVQVFVDGKELYPIPGDPHYPAEAQT